MAIGNDVTQAMAVVASLLLMTVAVMMLPWLPVSSPWWFLDVTLGQAPYGGAPTATVVAMS